MFWGCDLAFPITPKSGPLRAIGTLLDARRTMTRDLPAGYLKRPLATSWLGMMKAVDSGQAEDIKRATELLVCAFEHEGWLQRSPKDLAVARLQILLRAMEYPLRACMAVEARTDLCGVIDADFARNETRQHRANAGWVCISCAHANVSTPNKNKQSSDAAFPVGGQSCQRIPARAHRPSVLLRRMRVSLPALSCRVRAFTGTTKTRKDLRGGPLLSSPPSSRTSDVA
jgi:hypothetical protein